MDRDQRHRNPGPVDPVRLRRRRDVQQRQDDQGRVLPVHDPRLEQRRSRRCKTSPRTISTAISTARSPRATASTAATSSRSSRLPQQDLRAADDHRHRRGGQWRHRRRASRCGPQRHLRAGDPTRCESPIFSTSSSPATLAKRGKGQVVVKLRSTANRCCRRAV